MTEHRAAFDTAETRPIDAAEPWTIATRFGELAIDPTKILTFDAGLYGLELHRRFLLTSIPGWPDYFKLLQSVDDPGLSLIVLPLDGAEGPIDAADVEHACRTLGFDRRSTAVIGIVTLRDDSAQRMFTVNLKAPLLIDSGQRRGRQHVFASEKYAIRQPLAADGQAEG